MKNLDLIAAKAAQEIIATTRSHLSKGKNGEETEKNIKASDVDNLVTKALGVLQENGVYAVQLYLYSRGEADGWIAKHIREKLLLLPFELGLPKPEQTQRSEVALAFLTENICNDLDRLLMVKQLWEQTLIYARYGAKARSVAEKGQP